MNADLGGLVFGIAGTVSTVVVSALGLYFTARARVAPMQQLLYSKQLELAQRVFIAFGRARIFAVLLCTDNEYKRRARTDMGATVRRLSILTDEAAALFPTELYIVVKHASDALSSFVECCDEGQDTKVTLNHFRGQAVKAALTVRTLLGVDALSDESVRLFSRSDNLSGLAEINPAELLAKADEPEDTGVV